jgi:hypothetical protein
MKTLKPGNQNHRGLSAFFAGQKIHRFQAEQFGIHALPSLIANFEAMGLRFDRKLVSVPTNWGADAHVTLYWLEAGSYRLAATLLGIDPRNHPEKPIEAAETAYRRASGG